MAERKEGGGNVGPTNTASGNGNPGGSTRRGIDDGPVIARDEAQVRAMPSPIPTIFPATTPGTVILIGNPAVIQP